MRQIHVLLTISLFILVIGTFSINDAYASDEIDVIIIDNGSTLDLGCNKSDMRSNTIYIISADYLHYEDYRDNDEVHLTNILLERISGTSESILHTDIPYDGFTPFQVSCSVMGIPEWHTIKIYPDRDNLQPTPPRDPILPPDCAKQSPACIITPPDNPITTPQPKPIIPTPENPSNTKGGGCDDCTPPTLGLNTNFKRIIDNGFSYNGNAIQVDKWHTDYPLINATVGETNTVEIIVYENTGIHNLQMVQFGLGVEEFGQPLNELEVLIEISLITFNQDDKIEMGDLLIQDKNNLINNDTVTASSFVTQCMADDIDEKCVKIILQYSYREATINNMMLVNVQDKSNNSQNFYFNDGVQVLGDSLNESPTFEMYNKKIAQQTENIWLTLTRTDKINHIWEDKYGIEYLQVSESRFDRITPAEPYQCNDKPLGEVNVPTRNNCNFRALVTIWDN